MAEVSREVRIDGLADLERALAELPQKVARRMLGGALRSGGQVLAKQMRANIRSRTGALAKSVKVKTRQVGRYYTMTVRAGDKKAFYAHMVEGGTEAHTIKAKKGGHILKFAGGYYRSVDHPGISGQGFVKRAYQEKGEAAVHAFRSALRAQIEREWRKATGAAGARS